MLKQDITNKAIPMEHRLRAVQHYRQHLSDQLQDRQALWSLQSLSGEADELTLLLDGMDQGKFAVPRDPGLRMAAGTSAGHCARGQLRRQHGTTQMCVG